MARFHFNINDGHSLFADPEGVDLAECQTPLAEALEDARQLMSHGDGQGLCRRHWRMDVTTSEGELLFSLPFAHALRPDRLH